MKETRLSWYRLQVEGNGLRQVGRNLRLTGGNYEEGKRKVLGIFKDMRGMAVGRVPPRRGSWMHGGCTEYVWRQDPIDDRTSSCLSSTRATADVEAETPSWRADGGVWSAGGRDLKYFAPSGTWASGAAVSSLLAAC